MIDVKTAVAKALEYARELFSSEGATLEEIERDQHSGREVWSITLGFPEVVIPRSPSASPLAAALVSTIQNRKVRYKRILVDAQTGEFVAVKMREVAA